MAGSSRKPQSTTTIFSFVFFFFTGLSPFEKAWPRQNKKVKDALRDRIQKETKEERKGKIFVIRRRCYAEV